MARTHSELIQELRNDVTVIRAEVSAALAELERAELLRIRERLAVVEQRLGEFAGWKEEVRRLAVVEERVSELKRMKEEADRRYWQFVYLATGCFLTLVANILVTFLLHR